MNKFFKTIPVLRTIIRNYNQMHFAKKWRQRNSHNLTVAGERFFPVEVVTVGKASYGMLNIHCFFPDTCGKLVIGNYVSIAAGVSFMLDVNHQMNTITTFPLQTRLFKPTPKDANSKGPLIVEDEVWLGANAMILSGVTIGKGAIVAAGSIVTRDVPPYSIVGGNPAKVIRYRFSEEVIKELLPIRLADLPEEWLRENIELMYKKIESVDDVLAIKKLIHSNTSKT